MLSRSTIQLLRFHFSFFLMPVFLFALSQVRNIHTTHAAFIFIILHLLVYPSSNAYNSYMDRDEESIGGVEKPLQPTRELFIMSVLMDGIALALSLLISLWFTFGICAYILASRAYSYRGIRLKKYPFIGYLTVIIFQGAVVYFLVSHGASLSKTLSVPVPALLASALLIGGFYPLTQIYQFEADRKDGVRTISMALGYKGSFIFTAIIYSLAMGALYFYFSSAGNLLNFFITATVMTPVAVYFIRWAIKVWKDRSAADFRNAMRMNMLASVCANLAFLVLLVRRFFE